MARGDQRERDRAKAQAKQQAKLKSQGKVRKKSIVFLPSNFVVSTHHSHECRAEIRFNGMPATLLLCKPRLLPRRRNKNSNNPRPRAPCLVKRSKAKRKASTICSVRVFQQARKTSQPNKTIEEHKLWVCQWLEVKDKDKALKKSRRIVFVEPGLGCTTSAK